MGIDDRLLNSAADQGAAARGQGVGGTDNLAGGQGTSADRSAALNQARRGNQGPESESGGESDRPTSLREAVQTRKRQQAAAAKAAEAAGGEAATPMSRGTGKLLQQAWMHLPDSLGLSLIWINIHVFLGAIFGNKFFCKLGAEWLDNNIAAAQSDYAKKQGKMIGAVEPMGLACCNLGCLLAIISIFCLVGLLLGVLDNPFRIFTVFWGLIT